MAGILNRNVIEFLDFLDDEDEIEQRLPRRYIRDRENPIEFYNDQQFYQRYRFTKDTFVNQIMHIVNIEDHRPNQRGLPIPAFLQVLVALRFYATGDFQIVLGDLRGFSQSTVSRIIRRVSVAIASTLRQHVKFPSTNRGLLNFKAQFLQMGQFPGVIGAIDCTHVPIKSPGGQFAELYRNRKSWMSLNVQLICGPGMEILDIVCRWPGSTHDSRIFDNSAVKQKFEDGRLQGILVGDNGYPQSRYLFTPILDQRVATAAQRRYNIAHRRTRNIIERVNGVLKQRFQCLRRKLLTSIRTTQAIIVSCAILHNIGVMVRDIPEVAVEDPIVPVPNVAHNLPNGNVTRQEFIDRHFTH